MLIVLLLQKRVVYITMILSIYLCDGGGGCGTYGNGGDGTVLIRGKRYKS